MTMVQVLQLIQTRYHDKDTSASISKTGYDDSGTGVTVAAPALHDNGTATSVAETSYHDNGTGVVGLGYLASMTKVHRLQGQNMIQVLKLRYLTTQQWYSCFTGPEPWTTFHMPVLQVRNLGQRFISLYCRCGTWEP